MRVRPDSFLEAQLPHCPSFWVSSSYKALFLQMTFENGTFSKSQGRDLCGVPYNSSSHLPSGPGRGDLIPFHFCAAGWGLYLEALGSSSSSSLLYLMCLQFLFPHQLHGP